MYQTETCLEPDDFKDLNLVDHFIPLEECFVENFYPFDSSVSFAKTEVFPKLEPQQICGNELFGQLYAKPRDAESLSFSSSSSSSSPAPTKFDTSELSDYGSDHPAPNEASNSSATPLAPVASAQNDKPPESYANIIVKAILSAQTNSMQLKDIYNYMIEKYEFFSSQERSNKWKNSVRHNLSRHKYFMKTTRKNAQGHFWSIHPDFLNMFHNGEQVDTKTIKKAKLSYKFTKKSTKQPRKSTAATAGTSTTTARLEELDSSQNNYDGYLQPNSTMSSPMSCVSFNSALNNDSAYLSSSEVDSAATAVPYSNYQTAGRVPNFMQHKCYGVVQHPQRPTFQEALADILSDQQAIQIV